MADQEMEYVSVVRVGWVALLTDTRDKFYISLLPACQSPVTRLLFLIFASSILLLDAPHVPDLIPANVAYLVSVTGCTLSVVATLHQNLTLSLSIS